MPDQARSALPPAHLMGQRAPPTRPRPSCQSRPQPAHQAKSRGRPGRGAQAERSQQCPQTSSRGPRVGPQNRGRMDRAGEVSLLGCLSRWRAGSGLTDHAHDPAHLAEQPSPEGSEAAPQLRREGGHWPATAEPGGGRRDTCHSAHRAHHPGWSPSPESPSSGHPSSSCPRRCPRSPGPRLHPAEVAHPPRPDSTAAASPLIG